MVSSKVGHPAFGPVSLALRYFDSNVAGVARGNQATVVQFDLLSLRLIMPGRRFLDHHLVTGGTTIDKAQEYSMLALKYLRPRNTSLRIFVVKCRDLVSPSGGDLLKRVFAVPAGDSSCQGENIPGGFRVFPAMVPRLTDGGEYKLSVKCDDLALVVPVASTDGR